MAKAFEVTVPEAAGGPVQSSAKERVLKWLRSEALSRRSGAGVLEPRRRRSRSKATRHDGSFFRE